MEIIARELNKIIIYNGFKQTKIAERAGISVDTLNKILSGSRKSINTDTLFAVMNALELCKDEKLLADNEYKDKIINLFNVISQLPNDKREQALKHLETFAELCKSKD